MVRKVKLLYIHGDWIVDYRWSDYLLIPKQLEMQLKHELTKVT